MLNYLLNIARFLGAPLRCAPAYGSEEVISCGVLRHDFAGLGRDAPCGLDAQVMPCYVSRPYEMNMAMARLCAAPAALEFILLPTLGRRMRRENRIRRC